MAKTVLLRWQSQYYCNGKVSITAMARLVTIYKRHTREKNQGHGQRYVQATLQTAEDRSDQNEVGGHSYAVNGDGRISGRHRQPNEKIEQRHLQKVVEQMGYGETDAVFHGFSLLEGKGGRQQVVDQEARNIANGIGDIDIDNQAQQQINAIVNGRGYGTHYGKTDDFLTDLWSAHKSQPTALAPSTAADEPSRPLTKNWALSL